MYLSLLTPLQEVRACLDLWKSWFQCRGSLLSLEFVVPTSRRTCHRRPLWSFLPPVVATMLAIYIPLGRWSHAPIPSLSVLDWVPSQRRMSTKWYQTRSSCYSTLDTLWDASSCSQACSCSSQILMHLGTALHNTCAPERHNVNPWIQWFSQWVELSLSVIGFWSCV